MLIRGSREMLDVRCRMSDSRMSDVRCQMLDVRCQMSDVRCRMSDVGGRMSDFSIQYVFWVILLKIKDTDNRHLTTI